MFAVGNAQHLRRSVAERAVHRVASTGIRVMMIPDVQQRDGEQSSGNEFVDLVRWVGDGWIDAGLNGGLTAGTEGFFCACRLGVSGSIGLSVDDTGIGDNSGRRNALQL